MSCEATQHEAHQITWSWLREIKQINYNITLNTFSFVILLIDLKILLFQCLLPLTQNFFI